jgi:hypothetical protein
MRSVPVRALLLGAFAVTLPAGAVFAHLMQRSGALNRDVLTVRGHLMDAYSPSTSEAATTTSLRNWPGVTHPGPAPARTPRRSPVTRTRRTSSRRCAECPPAREQYRANESNCRAGSRPRAGLAGRSCHLLPCLTPRRPGPGHPQVRHLDQGGDPLPTRQPRPQVRAVLVSIRQSGRSDHPRLLRPEASSGQAAQRCPDLPGPPPCRRPVRHAPRPPALPAADHQRTHPQRRRRLTNP